MIAAISSRWYVFLIRGIAAILFGIICFARPGISLLALTILFGAFAFVDGVFALAAALGGLGGSRWWALLLGGLAGIIIAFFVWMEPSLSAQALVYSIAFWAIFTGITEIVAGLQLRDIVQNEWLYILAGIVSIAFGILIFRNVSAGALAVVWLIGAYAVLFGIIELGLSYRLRKLSTTAQTIRDTTTPGRPVSPQG